MKFRQRLIAAIFPFMLCACATTTKDTASEHAGRATALKGANPDIEVQVIGARRASDGWLEYQLKIHNRSSAPISDFRGILVDEAGTELEPATDPFMLSKAPSISKDVAMTTGAGLAGMALALVGIPFAGPLLAGGAIASQTMQADDSMSVSMRFARTSMIGRSVAINDHTLGSFFFPAVKPSNLRIGYLRGNARKWLVIGSTNEDASADSAEPIPSAARPTAEMGKPVGMNTPAVANISIVEAQRRLAALGYDPGPSDGITGPKTTNAIRRFQTNSGLPVSGNLDHATAGALMGK